MDARGRSRIVTAVFVATSIAAALFLARLTTQEDAGPPHEDVTIGPGIPATLYVPGTVDDRDVQRLPDPPPPGKRPPVVVLGHGFSSDRVVMSTLARSLAEAGYAVVAFDFRGHGQNRHSFRGGELWRDFDAVLDWVETSPHVDPERVVVMGHSMGATTAIEVASRDSRPDAVVAISGGRVVDGPRRPRNVLFLLASADNDDIRDRAPKLAARLAHRDRVARDRTYGDLGEGTGVRLTEVAHREHATVVWAGETVAESVAWMDAVFDIHRKGPVGLSDPRLGTAGLYIACALVLVGGLGWASGRTAPRAATRNAEGAWGSLAVLAVAILGGTLLVGNTSPAGFLSLAAADTGVAVLALAGAAVLLARRFRLGHATATRRSLAWLGGSGTGEEAPTATDLRRSQLRRSVATALVGVAGTYVLMAPVGTVFHRLVLTPERLLAAVAVAVVLLPYTFALGLLTLRGGLIRAAVVTTIARLLVTVVFLVAVAAGLLPDLLGVFAPTLLTFSIVFEVFALPAYAAGRNVTLIAVAESLFLGWMIAAIMPIG